MNKRRYKERYGGRILWVLVPWVYVDAKK